MHSFVCGWAGAPPAPVLRALARALSRFDVAAAQRLSFAQTLAAGTPRPAAARGMEPCAMRGGHNGAIHAEGGPASARRDGGGTRPARLVVTRAPPPCRTAATTLVCVVIALAQLIVEGQADG